MALFAYKAATAGVGESGVLTADDPAHARQLLRDRGLVIHDLRPARRGGQGITWGKWLSLGRRRAGEAQMTAFVRELATLLAVGVPMTAALDTIIRQTRGVGFPGAGGMRATLLDVRDRVAGGAGLAATMREHGPPFDELAVSMVEVGGASGTLETVLEQLASFKERSRQLKGKLTNALIYPCIVLTMAVLITLLLMTFVIPGILEPLTRAGKELPLITLVVKGMSDLLLGYWWALLALVVLAVATAAALWRSASVRLAAHRAILKTPLLGDAVRKQETSRIALVVSTLMRSGVHFLPAVEIAQRSTRNLAIRGALIRCGAAVHAGQDIADALEPTDAFPPAAVQVFAVGQKTGRLEEMLQRLASDYDAQVATAAQRFTSLLEPAMILLLAVFVGFIAFATILPILEAGHVL